MDPFFSFMIFIGVITSLSGSIFVACLLLWLSCKVMKRRIKELMSLSEAYKIVSEFKKAKKNKSADEPEPAADATAN